MNLFSTIVADPPWNYGDSLNRVNRGAANHYTTMTMQQIMDLPESRQSADAAHLYLWCTNAFMVEAHAVMAAWGFSQKTILTWVKPQIGMGHYYRNNTEHVLFGVKGKLPTLRKNQPTAFTAPRRKHSQKPDEFYQIVESMSPGPYLELFARGQREGWTVWGDEV